VKAESAKTGRLGNRPSFRSRQRENEIGGPWICEIPPPPFPLTSGRSHEKRARPNWISPLLATLVTKPFSDDDWIFEMKLDGIRCITIYDGNSLQLFSRNRKELNNTYPELIEPLVSQPVRGYIVDGEIVAFKGAVTSFSQLQQRMQIRNPDEARRRGIEVFYYVFDLLHLNDYDLREMPLIYRKELLKRSFTFHDPIRYSEHQRGEGEVLFKEACKNNLEGLIAKRANSPYASARSRDWLKFKCSAEQEFVIVGYTDPKGARTSFGALLVGYYEGDRLLYAGKVGTGFDVKTLKSLGQELASLQVEKPPVPGAVNGGSAHWIKPKLIAQLAFTEWTRDGKLRHPRFIGIRRDKSPRQVVRELPR
jgi:bifunctional non-homologous end joining protein LigD